MSTALARLQHRVRGRLRAHGAGSAAALLALALILGLFLALLDLCLALLALLVARFFVFLHRKEKSPRVSLLGFSLKAVSRLKQSDGAMCVHRNKQPSEGGENQAQQAPRKRKRERESLDG